MNNSSNDSRPVLNSLLAVLTAIIVITILAFTMSKCGPSATPSKQATNTPTATAPLGAGDKYLSVKPDKTSPR